MRPGAIRAAGRQAGSAGSFDMQDYLRRVQTYHEAVAALPPAAPYEPVAALEPFRAGVSLFEFLLEFSRKQGELEGTEGGKSGVLHKKASVRVHLT